VLDQNRDGVVVDRLVDRRLVAGWDVDPFDAVAVGHGSTSVR
jgi:hypothetical protein